MASARLQSQIQEKLCTRAVARSIGLKVRSEAPSRFAAMMRIIALAIVGCAHCALRPVGMRTSAN